MRSRSPSTGGTITQTGATTAASLTHAEQAPLEGHRVDAAPPMQVSASVQGMSLVLVYDEALDPASMPATGRVYGDGDGRSHRHEPGGVGGVDIRHLGDADTGRGAGCGRDGDAGVRAAGVEPGAGRGGQRCAGVQRPVGEAGPAAAGPCAGDGGGGRPGQRAVGGDLDGGWDTATGYTVQWMSGSQGYTTGDRQATVTSGSTTSHTIPSLTNGTEYTVRVIATRTGVTRRPAVRRR